MILFDNDTISPEHATVEMVNVGGYNRVFVIDMGSKYGTWVDGRRLIKGQRVD